MKKVVALVALSLLVAGCVSNGKVSVSREQLQHHRFVLESVDGKPINATGHPLELSFGEKMMISGNMCNRFNGQASLSDGALKVKEMAMTRMMCADPQLSELDNTLSTMLKQGAQVDLTANQLTLATAEHTLSYKLADLMQ
ncbi:MULTISPECIES: heat shock protein HslJ [Citrobacter]|jgi:heat shock protein HslJ|uniref:Heat shock protein HslJ n=1 Tax=Citrobacter amalonaticus TaxID=35703 RepID=A0A8I0MN24_CITAM|nr:MULTISPECIES: heat shock protein HslJ [Citrobacter]HAT6803095.1 heat shock protein HslJ [Citrobacter freundii]AMG94741.1 META domain-containing protein [Citrobacter amalonaticus]AUO64387.1 heat-inducible protein [Citrobacter freundii complex sp. CFNIH2]MBE0129844.1 heat shock protein HslJ [Citrobacter amalonaticus]MDT7075538.1 heat shock protein HslJ [Citrobacter amalonaticus]